MKGGRGGKGGKRTFREHKQLLHRRRRKRLAVERIEQWVDPPLEVIDESLLLWLKTTS